MDGVWVLLLTRSSDQQAKLETQSLVNLIENLTGNFPENTTIDGPKDYRWEIFSSQRSIEKFTHQINSPAK
jgi:hypothetical protein